MVRAIEHAQKQDTKGTIVVMAGYRHLPLGEYVSAKNVINNFSFPDIPDFNNYYIAANNYKIDKIKKSKLSFDEEVLGTTRDVYIKISSINNSIQAIPWTALTYQVIYINNGVN